MANDVEISTGATIIIETKNIVAIQSTSPDLRPFQTSAADPNYIAKQSTTNRGLYS